MNHYLSSPDTIRVRWKDDKFMSAATNFNCELDYYEVELIKNKFNGSEDINYTIRLANNNCINITTKELVALRRLLNNTTVSSQITIDMEDKNKE